MTSMEFTMIIKFWCIRETIEFSSKLVKDFLNNKSLLGLPLVLEKCGGVPIFYLLGHSFGVSRNTNILIPEQKAQVAILVIMASTIKANGRDLFKLSVFTSLRYIDKVRDYA